MERRVGEFFRAERLRRGLTLGQLARLLGYKNINKGARRIIILERTGLAKADIVVAVAEALNLDWTVIERLAEEDYQERLRQWEAWANEPVPMQIVIRLAAAVYTRKVLPADMTAPEAENLACRYARQNRCRVCLVVSRRISVWISAEGEVEFITEATPGQANIPYMQVGGRRFLLEG